MRYIWFCVWALLVTIPSSFLQVSTHPFRPNARNFKRWSAFWGGNILRGIGVRVIVEDNVQLDASKPYVFISNHQNLLDILALSAALPYPFGFVAKIELSKIPFLGIAIRNSACVFIDRSDPRASVESLQKAGERIRSGNSVLLFAEGSRSFSPELMPFKKGAFALAVEAGVPLVPVTIVDAYLLMNEKEKTVRSGTIRIVVGDPISLEGKRRRDIPGIMETAHERIDVPLAVQRHR